MKKIIIIVLLATTALVSNAQNCSKLVKIKKDPFTGKESSTTEKLWLYGVNSILFEKKDSLFNLTYTFRSNGIKEDVVKQGEEFKLMLDNGEIVKINAKRDFLGIINSSGYGTYTEWSVTCDISKGDLQKIANSVPKYITTVVFSDFKGEPIEIIKKYSKNVSEAAKCILQ